MNVLIIAFWLMLPAYIPNNCAALFGGGMPLDWGQTFQDGRRTLGDGKTFRGTIAGTVCGVSDGAPAKPDRAVGRPAVLSAAALSNCPFSWPSLWERCWVISWLPSSSAAWV